MGRTRVRDRDLVINGVAVVSIIGEKDLWVLS